MAITTTRKQLRKPELGDNPDVPRDIGNLADDLDRVANFDAGALTSRPPATGAGAATMGDRYLARDDVSGSPGGTEWVFDNGAWVFVGRPADPLPGIPGARTLGPGAQQAAPGNDGRFTDARTPLAHAASHQSGGSDAIPEVANSGLNNVIQPGAVGSTDFAGSIVGPGAMTQIGAGVYWLRNTAGVLIRTVLAAPALAHHEANVSSNVRIDSVVAYANGWNQAPTIQTITGTPTAGADLNNLNGSPGGPGGPVLPAGAHILRNTYHNPSAPPDGVSGGLDRRTRCRGFSHLFVRSTAIATINPAAGFANRVSLGGGVFDFRIEADGNNAFDIKLVGNTNPNVWYVLSFDNAGVTTHLREWSGQDTGTEELIYTWQPPAGSNLFRWSAYLGGAGPQLPLDIWAASSSSAGGRAVCSCREHIASVNNNGTT